MTSPGKVQTVLGPVDPKELGITLTHEHLSMSFEKVFTDPPKGDENKVNVPFSMSNLGWIRQYPYSHHPNLSLLEDEAAILEEIKQYKRKGGGALVENSTFGLERDLLFVRRVAEETGVHIIPGTGYYVDALLPSSTHKATLEDLEKKMTEDLVNGMEGTDIKAGVIGEVGCSWPLTRTEKKVLQASASTQSKLGCPLIIHPGRNHEAPFEIIRILQEAGGNISKTVMSHLDRSIHDYGELLEFAKLGSYLEYDLFGIEVSNYQLHVTCDMPSDAERIKRIKHLADHGYDDKLLISHDIHTRHRLEKYGGHGFCHILHNVVPMMKVRGFSQNLLDKIMIDNPREWLTFV